MPKPKNPAKWSDLECCTREGYALVMQGLASIVRVAQSEDLKLVLAAGEYLVEYGEGLMQAKAAAKVVKPVSQRSDAGRDEIIAELRGLYAKALGEAPLIVEAQAEVEEPMPEPRAKR